MLLLSVFLGAITHSSIQTTETDNPITIDINAILASPEYDHLVLIDVEIVGDERPLFFKVDEVIETIGLPPDTEIPSLANEIRERIHTSTGQEVNVEVCYFSIDRQ